MVLNIHDRELPVSSLQAGALIDSLASENDLLWPWDQWPPMRFDRSLEVGAKGGHGPVRYTVEAYVPGRSVCFRFTAPKGFLGTHRFEVEEVSSERVRLRHVIEMKVEGIARISWPLFFRPLHDALTEDALDRAEAFVGTGSAQSRRWSWWVKLLRWIGRRVI